MKESIQSHVNQLRDDLQTLPESESARVMTLLDKIEAELDADTTDDVGLGATVRRLVETFEVRHPRATAILNDILVKLDSMGI